VHGYCTRGHVALTLAVGVRVVLVAKPHEDLPAQNAEVLRVNRVKGTADVRVAPEYKGDTGFRHILLDDIEGFGVTIW
jgi:hypothetical protein